MERTVADGNVCYMAVPSQNKLEINTEYTIVIPYYAGNLHQASLYDRGNGFALQVGMINFTGNVGKFRIRNDKLTFSNNIELLFYTGDIVGNYLEISSNILILEGDHTNNPPSYFKGLLSVGQDVEEVNVESVNKNLFDGEDCYEVGSRQCFHVQQISNLTDFTISYDTEIKGNGTGKMWMFLSNTYVEGVLNHDVVYQRLYDVCCITMFSDDKFVGKWNAHSEVIVK